MDQMKKTVKLCRLSLFIYFGRAAVTRQSSSPSGINKVFRTLL